MFAAPLIVLAALVQGPVLPVRIATVHYDLEWEGARAEAEEAGRLLDSAFQELDSFFRRRPQDRMRVRVFRDEAARREGAWGDGASVPAHNRHALFSEHSRAVYVARQASPAVTRNVLLYGACLQFHALSKSKDLDVTRTWYAWGIALDFARSTWDGQVLRPFTRPLVEPLDLASEALLALGDGEPQLAKLSLTEDAEPALAWGIVALCLRGAGGRYLPGFRRQALGDSGTKLGTTDFLRTLGPNKTVLEDLRAALARERAPFEAIGAWEDRGAAGLVARPEPELVSYCVLRDAAELLSAEASALPARGARLGFVVGFGDADDCAHVDIEAPEVVVRVSRRGRATETSRHPIAGDARRARRIEIERQGALYRLHVDGRRCFELELPSGRLGFFASGAEVAFRDVAWR
ncbi:MAG: hypothetical protein JNK02_06755 [Planctomycetes bacterium]|nr:hypothetical protein [Planctomycetota bacterium]